MCIESSVSRSSNAECIIRCHLGACYVVEALVFAGQSSFKEIQYNTLLELKV